MKRQVQLIVAASVLGFSALAQNTPSVNTNAPTISNNTTASSTNAPPDADNTARNVRDRDSRTQTPLDQGNSQADINTTARIRKQIIASNRLSIDAKNVKIITMNGHVTLRGPVNTPDEKRRIGMIANRVAQSPNVDNQLEVKATASNN